MAASWKTILVALGALGLVLWAWYTLVNLSEKPLEKEAEKPWVSPNKPRPKTW